jgi:hypothetical protein
MFPMIVPFGAIVLRGDNVEIKLTIQEYHEYLKRRMDGPNKCFYIT